MNWKTYQKLSPKLQKEYDFRFSEKKKPNVRPYVNFAITITAIITILMFTTYIMLTDDNFIDKREQIIDIFAATANLITLSMVIIIGMSVYDAIDMFVFYYSYAKWRRKNKIKVEMFWQNWRFQRKH